MMAFRLGKKKKKNKVKESDYTVWENRIILSMIFGIGHTFLDKHFLFNEVVVGNGWPQALN